MVLKSLMALSGLIMVGYLLLHMYGNLKLFSGQEAFDNYSHYLRVILYPLLPHSGLLWIIRVVLLASVVAHFVSAITLWRRNVKARGGTKRYHSKQAGRGVQRSYSSFTLRWGGVVILLFVIYHLLHLTWNVVSPGGASDSPYERVVHGFQIWWVVLSYTIALLAVGFHLHHGIGSALTTLGANTSAKARSFLKGLSLILALLITVGFLLPPFFVLFGVVK